MVSICNRIVSAPLFQNTVIGVIIFSAVLVGIKTYPELYARYKDTLYLLDTAVLAFFTIEVAMRIIACGKRPVSFFRSPWNVFDFAVTAVFYIPVASQYAGLLRIARVLRVLRLITAIPRLQMLVGALVKSVPSLGYIALLMFIQFYVFAVIGNFAFGQTAPQYFGMLHVAMLTLFQIITLEGWTSIMHAVGPNPFAPAYFVIFILMGTMVVLNLFIGVVMNGFDEVKREMEAETLHHVGKTSHDDIREIAMQIDALKKVWMRSLPGNRRS